MPQVRVTARRRIAQFLVFNPAVLEIDGAEAGHARWGTTVTVEVPAGRHRLTVSSRISAGSGPARRASTSTWPRAKPSR
jgi:hypothetical protein